MPEVLPVPYDVTFVNSDGNQVLHKHVIPIPDQEFPKITSLF